MTRNRFLMMAAVSAFACLPAVAIARTAGQPPASAQNDTQPAAGAALAVRTGADQASARLTLFCDVEDEACSRLVLVLGRLIDSHGGQVGITFRHLAPDGHAQSPLAYRAALAAARQGRGWEFLDMACANRDRLDGAGLKSMAAQLGLDLARFEADADGPEAARALDDDAKEAKTAGLESVPALLLNGSRYEGAFTYDDLVKALGLGPD